MSEFKEFPKITRFYEQNVCITEKLDDARHQIKCVQAAFKTREV